MKVAIYCRVSDDKKKADGDRSQRDTRYELVVED